MQEFEAMTVKEIKKWLNLNPHCVSKQLLARLNHDPRKGVQQLSFYWERKLKKELLEQQRLHLLFRYESLIIQQGYQLVAGVDEAGRGPLAGPVVAAAVILPCGCYLKGLDDSKKLTSPQRERLYKKILELALGYGIAQVDNRDIDQMNIAQATYLAMRKAIANLKTIPDYLLIDGAVLPGIYIPQRRIIKGDQKSASIAAASILAKVTRDKIMREMDKIYPGYGFERHKGYGTKEHLLNLEKLGVSSIHRKSYEPVHRIIQLQSLSPK